MPIVWKILITIIAVIVTQKYIAPLLMPLFPPFGVIALIVLYIVILLFVLGKLTPQA